MCVYVKRWHECTYNIYTEYKVIILLCLNVYSENLSFVVDNNFRNGIIILTRVIFLTVETYL